jgi:hypothetical protein
VPGCTCSRDSRSPDPRCAPNMLALRAKSWSIRPQSSQDHSLKSCQGLAPFNVMTHKSPGLSTHLYTGYPPCLYNGPCDHLPYECSRITFHRSFGICDDTKQMPPGLAISRFATFSGRLTCVFLTAPFSSAAMLTARPH